MVPNLTHYLILSGAVFSIGVSGILINRNNLVVLLMSIEIMFLSVGTNFIAFSTSIGDHSGQMFVFFILTVAAAEAAIGLSILILLFRKFRAIDANYVNKLRG